MASSHHFTRTRPRESSSGYSIDNVAGYAGSSARLNGG
jgi:hypothetical protein